MFNHLLPPGLNLLYSPTYSPAGLGGMGQFMGFTSIGADTLSRHMQAIWRLQNMAKETPFNDTPSLLVMIEKIPGVSQVGGSKTSIEADGYTMWGTRPVSVGDSGQLQVASHISFSDLYVSFPTDTFFVKSFQDCYEGTNVGTVTVTNLRNYGKMAKVEVEVEVTDARISLAWFTLDTCYLAFSFNQIRMNYFRMDEKAELQGTVPAAVNLPTNALAATGGSK